MCLAWCKPLKGRRKILIRKGTRATLNDVAREARVSTATVSRCLNFPERVSPEARERVDRAVERLGYTPHFGGRALASNRSNTVGAVIPTMENAIFARGLQALEEALSARGVTLLVATSDYDVRREAQQIRTLMGRGVDGLVLIGEARPQATYDLLQARGVPFVLVWNPNTASPHCSVGFDNRSAARKMSEVVLASGHRRVAMIAGVTEWNDRASDRVAGVRDALAQQGLSLAPPYFVEAVYSLEAGAAAAQSFMALDAPPTAIVCGNDVLAAGAIIGLGALGAAVPADVSVVGFDNIDLAIAVTPALTTVHVPHRRMGRAAAALLHTMIADDGPGESVVLETEIVHRASLAAPPHRGGGVMTAV
jgi:LacI family transcriptional regulator